MENMMMMMNKSLLVVNNQRWAGDKLAAFVRAILKECSCSMMLIAGQHCSRPRSKNKRDIMSLSLICISQSAAILFSCQPYIESAIALSDNYYMHLGKKYHTYDCRTHWYW